MDLLGVDGFNGWSKSPFIYFIFLAAAASGILCIFLAVTACLGYLDVELHWFPSWWTFFFHSNWDTFCNGMLRYTSIYEKFCAVLEMVIRHDKYE